MSKNRYNQEFKICQGKNSCGKKLSIDCFRTFKDKNKNGKIIEYPCSTCINCLNKRSKKFRLEIKNLTEQMLLDPNVMWEKDPDSKYCQGKNGCNQLLPINKFRLDKTIFSKRKKVLSNKFRTICIDCDNNQQRISAKINAKQRKEYKKQRGSNPEIKQKITKYNREYSNSRKQNDFEFKLRKQLSSRISNILKRNSGGKGGDSILKGLEFTPQQLITHLMNHPEKEEWMNIDNHGIYDPNTWNDNDPLTWTWQIDHIVPISDLPALSMDDENFKKAWALNNLRPLSSKKNILDGTNRTRHKKENK